MTDFIEDNRPKHHALEAMRDLIAEPGGESFLKYVGAFSGTADTQKTRPTNLLDLYIPDIREVYMDSQRRPDHYEERLHEMIRKLMAGQEVSDPEKNELLVVYLGRTIPKPPAQKTKPKNDDDEIILEDGTSLNDFVGVFELQNFDKIVL